MMSLVRWMASVSMMAAVIVSAPKKTAAVDSGTGLTTVLAQMDAASTRFKSARADVTSENYEAVVSDTTTDHGPIYFERVGNGTQMGAVILNPKTGKAKTIYQYKGGVFEYYDVGQNQLRVMKAGSNQVEYESFLTLGFGGSGKELAKAWEIKDAGSEMLMDEGKPVKVEKLELLSKDPGVLKEISNVTVWVDTERGVSLRQLFVTPSHNRHTATYSHIRLNGKIDAGTFEIPKGAQKVN